MHIRQALRAFLSLWLILLVAFTTGAAQAASVSGQATMTAFGETEPVAAQGATVRLCITMPGSPLNCFLPVASVLVGDDGAYALTVDNAGSYVLQAIFPDGGLLHASTLTITTADETLQRDVHLEPVTFDINGRVVGAGFPVNGARVELRYAGTPTVLLMVESDAAGDYRLPQVPAGNYDLLASPPAGLHYAAHEVRDFLVENTSRGQDFELVSDFNLAGNVSAGGLSLPLASVRLYARGGGSARGDLPLATAQTSVVGNYSLRGVPAGTYDLEIEPPTGVGYGLLRVADVVLSGGADLRDFVLYSVTGRVTESEGGDPLAGVNLRVCDSGGCEVGVLASLLTDEAGYYVLANPPVRDWLFSILLPGYGPYERLISLTDDVDLTIDIAMTGFRGITGTVLAGGVPLANATVSLTLSGSATLEDSVRTNAEGKYWLWHPPGGEHDLAVAPPEGSPYRAASVARFGYESGTVQVRDVELVTDGFAIAGQVRGENHGDGLAGVRVQVLANGSPAGEATTDAAGRYRVAGLAAGTFDVLVRPPAASGYPLRVLPGVRAGAGYGNVQLDVHLLAGTAALSGTLFQASTGQPVAGAVLDVCMPAACDGDSPSPVVASVTADAQGRFRVEGLPFGILHLRVAAEGYLKQVHTLSISGVEAQQDLGLVRVFSVSGQLRADGNPVAGAQVALYHPHTDLLAHAVAGNGDGRFVLTNVLPGVYDLVVTPSPASRLFRTLVRGVVVADGPLVRDVDLSGVPAGAVDHSVRGTVTGAGAAPLAGVVVRLFSRGEGGLGLSVPAAEAASDSLGRFSLPVVPFGDYVLHVQPPEGSSYAVELLPDLRVGADGLIRDIALGLSPAAITGKVTSGEDGAPLAGADVEICKPGGDEVCATVVLRVLSSLNGDYLLAGLPAGNWVLRVRLDGRIEYRTSVALQGSNLVRNIGLQRANAVRGLVLGNGQPAAGVMVFLRAGSTDLVLDQAVTGLDGRYALTRVPNGTHHVEANPPDGSTFGRTRVEGVVVADLDQVIDIVLGPRPGRASGQVTDESGAPIAGALVQACPAFLASAGPCPNPSATTQTDSNGIYLLDLPPGEWCVFVSNAGRVTHRYCLAVVGGGEYIENCTLIFMPGIAGRVSVGQPLQPLPGARVDVYLPGGESPIASAVTDAQGDYFIAVPDAVYDLVATPPAGAPYLREVRPGVLIVGVTRWTPFVLHAAGRMATLEGQVVDREGVPLSGITVGLYQPDSMLVFVPPVATSVTDAAGRYAMTVPEGTYRLSLQGDGYHFLRRDDALVVSGVTRRTLEIPLVTVAGTVRGADGAPVPDVLIEAKRGDFVNLIRKRVVTDAQGQYRLRVPAGVEVLHVMPEDPYRPLGVHIALLSENNLVRDIDLALPVAVRGVARDLGGRVVAGRHLFFVDPLTAITLGQARTDAAGRYTTLLSPVVAEILTPLDGTQMRLGDELDLRAGPVERDLVMPFLYLSGVVHDADGTAVPGVSIRTRTPGYPGWQASAVSDAQGRYRIYLLAGNPSFRLAPPSGNTVHGLTLTTQLSLTGDTVHDLVIGQLQDISGRVTDHAGAVLAGMRLELRSQGETMATGLTDAQGRYHLRAVPGDYVLGVYGDDFGVTSAALFTVTGALQRDVTIELLQVRGRTLDINGVAAPRVNVGLSVHAAYAVERRSDAGGHFDFRVPANPVVLARLQPTPESRFIPVSEQPIALLHDHDLRLALTLRDERPPAIVSAPRALAVSRGAALIVWQTDEPATSAVLVNGQTHALPGYRRDHAVAVSGLGASQLYEATVLSSDRLDNGPSQAVVVFSTPAAPDRRAPGFLAAPVVTTPAPDRAIVEWTTDEPATTRLFHGTGSADTLVEVPGLRTVHRVDLTGLAANTHHVARVEASDVAGNGPTRSATVPFRTPRGDDRLPPLIVAGPVVTAVTNDSVTLAWETDEPSTSGVSANDGSAHYAVRDEMLVRAHEMTLSGLLPGVTYAVTVSSADGSGNGPTLSVPLSLTTATTPDTQPPAMIEPPRIVQLSAQSATVQWRTDEPAEGLVEYGLSVGQLDQVAGGGRLTTRHSVQLTDLQPGTAYFLRVRVIDAAGNEAVSPVLSLRARTQTDNVAPVFTSPPTVLGATATTVTLGWETSEPTDYRLTWGVDAIDEFQTADARRERRRVVTLGNLEPGRSYAFAVTVADAAGNSTTFDSRPAAPVARTSRGKAASTLLAMLGVTPAVASTGSGGGFATAPAATPDTPPSLTVEPTVVWVSDDRAMLAWTADEPVTAQLAWRLAGTADAWQYAGDVWPALQHGPVLSGLQAGQTYEYQLDLRDAGGAVVVRTGTFTLAATADVTAPVLGVPGVSERGPGSVVVSVTSDEPVTHEVRYGLAGSATLAESVLTTRYDTLQSLVLTGLAGSSPYDYEVHAVDPAGNTTVSARGRFVSPTGPPPATVAPAAGGGGGGAVGAGLLLVLGLLLLRRASARPGRRAGRVRP